MTCKAIAKGHYTSWQAYIYPSTHAADAATVVMLHCSDLLSPLQRQTHCR